LLLNFLFLSVNCSQINADQLDIQMEIGFWEMFSSS
jgi:hypothetical protein